MMQTNSHRPRRRATIQVQPRDLAILRSLAAAHLLTLTAIEWLHWPNWEAHAARWQASSSRGAYKPQTHVATRMRSLIGSGLVQRLAPPTLPDGLYEPAVPLYALADGGMELLYTAGDAAEVRGQLAVLSPRRFRQAALASDWYAAWCWQHRCPLDRVQWLAPTDAVLQPVVTVHLDQQPYQVIVDDGMTPVAAWQHMATHNDAPLVVLAPTAHRIARVQQAIAPTPDWRWYHRGQVHPHRIGEGAAQ